MSIARVHYLERQRLTAADLRFEQEYRLGMGGRHHLAHHDWGVVRGLRVVPLSNGVFRLTPGVAIDGYGREIVVPSAVEVEIEGFKETGCWFLILHYCEDPEQVPPGRQCKDEPAPRIRQRAAWRLAESFPSALEPAEGLAGARAAGRMADLPPWPVLVATIGTGCEAQAGNAPSLVDYSRTTYVRHRASTVHSPTASALLQLGLSGRQDVYHFLVSTRNPALNKRIGIDRDRALHVWRPLVIAGTQAYGEVAIGHSLKLQISTALPAGIHRRIRIDGRFDAELRTLSASLLDFGAASAGPQPSMQGSIELKKMSISLPFADGRTTSFQLLDVAKLQPIGFADARRRFHRTRKRAASPPMDADEPVRGEEQSFSAELKPNGGKLALRKQAHASEIQEVPCGDVDRTRGATRELDTSVLQFKPASEIEADPLAREIHAVSASGQTDTVPRTELRISGGAADDSDASSRVSIGGQTGGQYVPGVRMDGGRRVEILAAAQRGAQCDSLLEVTDTVYLPPIGKGDPLLPDLLALAFIGGLRRIGNVTTNPTLELLPESGSSISVVRSATLRYKLKITWSGQFAIKRTLELITGPAGMGDMSFRALDIQISPDTQSPLTVSLAVPCFTRAGSEAAIQVLMLVQLGNLTRVAVAPPKPVHITDT